MPLVAIPVSRAEATSDLGAEAKELEQQQQEEEQEEQQQQQCLACNSAVASVALIEGLDRYIQPNTSAPEPLVQPSGTFAAARPGASDVVEETGACQQRSARGQNPAPRFTSKLKATSAVFYPRAYITAAAANAACSPGTSQQQQQQQQKMRSACTTTAAAAVGVAAVTAAAAAGPHVFPAAAEAVVPLASAASGSSSTLPPDSPHPSLPSLPSLSMANTSRAPSISSSSSSSFLRPQHSTNTVTVSALSSVKDAAGGLSKVLTKRGACLLLALHRKPVDKAAGATHLAAKTLAVARFYINTRMAAAGAAGVKAAAALVGLQGGEGPGSAGAMGDGAAARACKEEVLFVPYHHKAAADGGVSSAAGDMDSFGFVVSTAPADMLPVKLPSPVGTPQSMANRPEQFSRPAAAAAENSAPLLKASAHTDVNRLSNALIHHLMDAGHVALQLAGAAACQVAMEALVKARLRLERKFNSGLVACAAFANEDTSNALGRSTVFLRLDVLRCGRDMQLLGPEAAGALAVAAQNAWDL